MGLGMLKHFAEHCSPETQLFSCSRSTSPELEELGKRENVHLIKMDISSEESVQSAVERVTELLGGEGLNLLVNNAAVLSWDISTKIVDTSAEELNDLYNLNTTSTHRVTTSFYPLLKLSAATNSNMPMCAARALIINFSSKTSSLQLAPPFGKVALYSYSLAKCALNMMTRLCAHEFKSDGVLCVAVNPGAVKTDMGKRAGAELGSTGGNTVDLATLHMVEIMTRATEEHTGLYLAKDMEKLPF
jgi:NAD(P)-dependent dehydrogenase (short-subunit alcohol dehydrogenase family)